MRACEPTGVRDPGTAWRCVAALVVCTLLVGACSSGGSSRSRGTVDPGTQVSLAGIHLIKHVVVIMQENRSFDSYFGTFPGADGIPMKNGKPTVCVPDPVTKHVCRAVRRPRTTSTAAARTARQAARPTSTAARWTASSGRPQSGRRVPRPHRSRRCSTPGQNARRDGVPHRERHPELLDLRQGLRPPGPHVRAERLVEPSRAPVPGLGMVGRAAPSTTTRRVCNNVDLHVRTAGACPTGNPLGPTKRADDPDLRVDRPHVPAAQEPRVSWGYYVVPRHRARLRERRRDLVRHRDAERQDPRHLEPAARTSTRCTTTTSSATSSRSPSFYAAAKAGTLPAVVVGRAVGRGQRAPARARQLRAEPT